MAGRWAAGGRGRRRACRGWRSRTRIWWRMRTEWRIRTRIWWRMRSRTECRMKTRVYRECKPDQKP